MAHGFHDGFRDNCRFGMSAWFKCHSWRNSRGLRFASVIIEGFFTSMRFHILLTHEAVFTLLDTRLPIVQNQPAHKCDRTARRLK
jgi:hypothetical protein